MLDSELKQIQIFLGIILALGTIVGGIYTFGYNQGFDSAKTECKTKDSECKIQPGLDGDWIMNGQCIEIIKGIMNHE